VDFFCGILVGWFILKIVVMLVGCSGLPIRCAGGTFHMYYGLGRKSWRTSRTCTAVRIENLDRDASCSFTNIRYYCSKSTTTTNKLKGFCKSLYVMVL